MYYHIGANINAQTDETQETALTLACCGGFSEVADFLIKAGADIELGASTPLMEAAQEGHLELVKYLLQANANVHAQTQTGDTALTYACENGHTDVADLLLECNADLVSCCSLARVYDTRFIHSICIFITCIGTRVRGRAHTVNESMPGGTSVYRAVPHLQGC